MKLLKFPLFITVFLQNLYLIPIIYLASWIAELTPTNVIAIVGLIFTLGTLIWGIYQYAQAQKWKRLEYLAKEIQDFNKDRNVALVKLFLDSNNRLVNLDLEGKSQSLINSELLVSSLHNDKRRKDGAIYTDENLQIRYIFEAFFERLLFFAQALDSEVLKPRDLEIYLDYWLKSLLVENEFHNELPITVKNFLEKYKMNKIIEFSDKVLKKSN